MGRSIFITGTDTGVGKTYFTSGVVRALRGLGVDAVGFKPIECGGRSDGEALLAASGGGHTLDEINPVWLEQALAPMAAVDSVEQLELERVMTAYEALEDNHELVIVEGAGGWLVPLKSNSTMADLAFEWSDEVIIVAANRLGVINHTLLTYRAIKQGRMECSRVILNHLPGPEPDSGDISQDKNAETLKMCLPSVEIFELVDDSGFENFAKSLSIK